MFSELWIAGENAGSGGFLCANRIKFSDDQDVTYSPGLETFILTDDELGVEDRVGSVGGAIPDCSGLDSCWLAISAASLTCFKIEPPAFGLFKISTRKTSNESRYLSTSRLLKTRLMKKTDSWYMDKFQPRFLSVEKTSVKLPRWRFPPSASAQRKLLLLPSTGNPRTSLKAALEFTFPLLE